MPEIWPVPEQMDNQCQVDDPLLEAVPEDRLLLDNRLLDDAPDDFPTYDVLDNEQQVGEGQPASAMDLKPGVEGLPQGKDDEYGMISVEEHLLRHNWMNWEDDLRRAHQQRLLAQSTLAWRIPPHLVRARHLTAEEEARFGIWKAQYIYQPGDFEDGRMAAGAFGLWE